MSHYDFRTPRLHVDAPLRAGAAVTLDRDRANYLFNVLRLGAGDAVLLFNGRDGEWRATVAEAGKRAGTLALAAQERAQPEGGRVELLFAPLKHARLDYMVQKAVEMGAARIQPVITRHTQVARVNLDERKIDLEMIRQIAAAPRGRRGDHSDSIQHPARQSPANKPQKKPRSGSRKRK